jgi:SPP1 family predicted phage head-tail adaptor
MRTGTLDQRVALYSVAETRDEAGGPVAEATLVAEVWAAVISQRGDESFKAAQQTAARTIKVKLRWREDVQTAWLLDWNGDRYDITDVDRSLRRDGELWLMATLRSGA